MSDETGNLSPEVRRKIGDYLDAIERVLAGAGMDRAARRNITDDVETQILDMLARRAGYAPTVADVEAVLAQLDPPEAYAREGGEKTPGEPSAGPAATLPSEPIEPRLSRLAIAGAACAPWFFLWCFLTLTAHVVVVTPDTPRPTGPAWWQILLLIVFSAIGLASPFATTFCGFAAISQIRRSAGRFYGLPLAVFEALLFPLLALDVAVGFIWSYGLHALNPARAGGVAAEAARALPTLLQNTPFAVTFWTILTSAILDGLVVFYVWRAASRPVGVGESISEMTPERSALLGKIALAVCLGGILLTGVIAAIAKLSGHDIGMSTVWFIFLPAQVAAFVLGILARRKPLGKAAAIISAVLAAASLLTMA